MSFEEEIRLFGHPISIILPGTVGQSYAARYSHRQYPTLYGATRYEGYALCDVNHITVFDTKNIYLDIGRELFPLGDYMMYCDDLPSRITLVQPEVTYSKIHKMIFTLYEQLQDKADK